jgi:hypothetical protein
MEIGVNSNPQSMEILSELSRATTAYHEAAPDGVEAARQNYIEVLRKFNQSAEPQS